MFTAPIVVGVDGSPVGLRAVDLAVREAEIRDRPLQVVFADTGQPGAESAQVVQAALDRITARSPVPATGEIVADSPVAALVQESEHAALIVVGHRGQGGIPTLALGSVARNVATHARCPVLVARGAPDAAGPVLVGVHCSPHGDPAVGFAFEEASLRGAEVVALHAWTGPVCTGAGDMLPLVYDPDVVAADQARVLAESLAGWQTKYPDVVVHRRLVCARPGSALVEASGQAQLVVVGAHGHRAVTGWLIGSVTHVLLHQAGCPVAVVRPA